MRRFEKFDARKETRLPERATRNSAGYDFYCNEPVRIQPGEKVAIPTNVKVNMEADEVFLIFARSSVGIKHDLMLCNGVGVIDSDYPGQIYVYYKNMGVNPFSFKKGDRIAQGVFYEIPHDRR